MVSFLVRFHKKHVFWAAWRRDRSLPGARVKVFQQPFMSYEIAFGSARLLCAATLVDQQDALAWYT